MFANTSQYCIKVFSDNTRYWTMIYQKVCYKRGSHTVNRYCIMYTFNQAVYTMYNFCWTFETGFSSSVSFICLCLLLAGSQLYPYLINFLNRELYELKKHNHRQHRQIEHHRQHRQVEHHRQHRQVEHHRQPFKIIT